MLPLYKSAIYTNSFNIAKLNFNILIMKIATPQAQHPEKMIIL